MSDCCLPALFVTKPDDVRVRWVTGYTKLNRYVKRPIHPFPSVHDIVQSIPAGWHFFTKMDVTHGYFQLTLEDKSLTLMKFMLPSDRYSYSTTRAPMGLSSSSDEWCYQSDSSIEGIQFAKKIVDDILVWADSMPQLLERVKMIAERCKQ